MKPQPANYVNNIPLTNVSQQEMDKYYEIVNRRSLEANNGVIGQTKYLSLGDVTVKIENFSEELITPINTQFAYVLRDAADSYDVIFRIWNEEVKTYISDFAQDIKNIFLSTKKASNIELFLVQRDGGCTTGTSASLQTSLCADCNCNIDAVLAKENASPARTATTVTLAYDPKSKTAYLIEKISLSTKETPEIELLLEDDILSAYDPKNKIAYFSAKEISTKHLSKMGHLFVRLINKMVKTPTSALVHSAAVGIDNTGVLICGRAERGKSTLAISCLLDGFQYVSDDYLILTKTDQLYAYPIYSIIYLSMQAQEKMKEPGATFLYDNHNGKKHALDISSHHDKFVEKLPIKIAIFPNIADIEKPTIEPIHGGQAIAQLVHSTAIQMGERKNPKYFLDLMSLVSDLDFYQTLTPLKIRSSVLLIPETSAFFV
ncbi:hypothetical protein FACS1894122_08920 [Alphaproteobacteria bacterium]|nr:hypothetical protein FACS1894122_08920 [Alphaproteobacteria bacterium]